MFKRFIQWLTGNKPEPRVTAYESGRATVFKPSPEDEELLGRFELVASTDPDFDTKSMDPMMAEAVMRAVRTGNIVIGNRDNDGNVSITEVKD